MTPKNLTRNSLKKKKDADLIVGSRYIKGSKIGNWPKKDYL